MYRAKLRSILLVAGLLLSGCIVVHDHPPQGRAVGHHKLHVHGVKCGHVWHSGRWVTVSITHVHGLGCGHFFVNGRWQVSAPG